VDHHEIGLQLADAVEAALPGWVRRSVERVARAWAGEVASPVLSRADEEGARAVAEVGPELRRLLTADVDAQWTTPLSLLRGVVRYPTAVLTEAGVPPVVRDDYDERHFPDDRYGLTPRTFADVDPSLHDLGLRWAAAKARASMARHRGA
jgi:hypothetical protein